jgi:hypothetical protein
VAVRVLRERFTDADELRSQLGLSEQGDSQCSSAFDAYVGVPDGMSQYAYAYVEPVTSGDWAVGDRELECVAYAPENGVLNGSEMTITDSIKGTR